MTVAELCDRLSNEELAEWQAFYSIAPWGSAADDQRAQASMSLFFAANSERGATIPNFFDRTPDETARAARLAEDPFEALARHLDGMIARAEQDDDHSHDTPDEEPNGL